MPFVILACTDILREKINVELPLREPPASLNELHRILEHVFRGEESNMRGKKLERHSRLVEPFVVSRVQRYLDDRQMWVEINDTRELREHDQLYVFRKNATRSDISVQREIPEPRKSSYLHTFYAAGSTRNLEPELRLNLNERSKLSPSSRSLETRQHELSVVPRSSYRTHANGMDHNSPVRPAEYLSCVDINDTTTLAAECGRNSSIGHTEHLSQEVVETIFRVGDSTHRGYLTARDFQSIFNACQIEFSPDVIEELYRSFAREKRGEPIMSFQDFCNYAKEFVQTVGIAYARLSSKERHRVIEQEQHESISALSELNMQKKALEERLVLVQNQIVKEQERKARLQSEAEELRRVKDSDYREQEQRLLDKEVSVFRYRQKLQREEMDYERLAAERKRRIPSIALGYISTQTGSDPYKLRD